MAKSEIAARLKTEVIAAMKAKDKARLGVLRMLQAAVKQVEVDERRELGDEDLIRILGSYGRKVKDQIKSYGDGGRLDLKSAAETEMAIVEEFLPAQLDEAKLEALVRQTMAEVAADGMKDMGKVIKAVMPKVQGAADGGRVSALVKKLLGG